MGLFKPIGTSISGFNISLDSNICVWVNDSIDLTFQLKSWDISTNKLSKGVSLNGLIVYILIENPLGEDFMEPTKVFKDMVTIHLGKDHTKYSGKGKLQFRFIDQSGNEIKSPYFEYEVKGSINELLDSSGEIVKAHITEDGKLLLTEDGRLLIYY